MNQRNVHLPLLQEPSETWPRAEADERNLLQVGDLARLCGKTVRAIHLYEELGLLTPAARSRGRYRLYASTSLVRVRWIGKLQDMGFSLTDIQSLVRDWDDQRSATSAMAKMRELYARQLAETRAHIVRLQALEREIVSSIDYLDTCDVCDPERLVASCTSCEHHAVGTRVPELVSGYSVALPAAPASSAAAPSSPAHVASLDDAPPAPSRPRAARGKRDAPARDAPPSAPSTPQRPPSPLSPVPESAPWP